MGAATFEGLPCKFGHTARYVRNRCCVECARLRAKPKTEEARRRKNAYKLEWDRQKHNDPTYRAKRLARQKEMQQQRRAQLKADKTAYEAFLAARRNQRAGAIREIEVEKYLVAQVERAGGFCPKWIDNGHRGAPDRIVMLPQGRLVFAELKRPEGGWLEPHQVRYHERIRAQGQKVMVLKSKAEVDAWLAEVLVHGA